MDSMDVTAESARLASVHNMHNHVAVHHGIADPLTQDVRIVPTLKFEQTYERGDRGFVTLKVILQGRLSNPTDFSEFPVSRPWTNRDLVKSDQESVALHPSVELFNGSGDITSWLKKFRRAYRRANGNRDPGPSDLIQAMDSALTGCPPDPRCVREESNFPRKLPHLQ
ncbi:uncharacterized protein CPUR_05483 [Claviceps purpurea 20.1]|uniref:Uncharacterized protein n=1 Tax=Claviceps purpurea (strain 20.1) TaxID=1111077 RepID=M1W867_CLAP2|nr:uncharacterized protein CPUR_05483 [Claviceps purpurea 20.1]